MNNLKVEEIDKWNVDVKAILSVALCNMWHFREWVFCTLYHALNDIALINKVLSLYPRARKILFQNNCNTSKLIKFELVSYLKISV